VQDQGRCGLWSIFWKCEQRSLHWYVSPVILSTHLISSSPMRLRLCWGPLFSAVMSPRKISRLFSYTLLYIFLSYEYSTVLEFSIVNIRILTIWYLGSYSGSQGRILLFYLINILSLRLWISVIFILRHHTAQYIFLKIDVRCGCSWKNKQSLSGGVPIVSRVLPFSVALNSKAIR